MNTRKLFLSIGLAAAAALATATWFTGCATTGSTTPAQTLVSPASLHFVAENATYFALTKYPAALPAFEAAVSGITNSIAGGTLSLNTTNLLSTLNALGYGGLAREPGAALFISDLNFAASQFDAQFPSGNSGGLNNTNVVAALNAVASGIQAGIADYQ